MQKRKYTITRATYYRKSSVTTWTNANMSFSSGTDFVFGSGAISTESSYDIKYTITYAFTTITIYYTISTAAVLMDFKAGGKGIAIGKAAEKDNIDEDGNLVIDPEQAEVVKRIYREYLEGYSMDKIAADLEADGILTGAGKPRWHTSTINKILRNEKYIGDALLQKTYTTNFLNKTRVKNNGIVPQYYVEGNHEAIIPKDIFLRVQEELVCRRAVKTSANVKKRSYSCNHCFAQIIVCGDCSEMFRRIHWNNRGCKSIVWRCISRLEATGQECHARTVNETVLENVVVKAINQLLGDKSSYQTKMQQNIAKVIRDAPATTTDGIDEQLMELQQELLKKANNKEAYDEIADQIFKLREQRQKCTIDTAARDAQIERINELQDFIKA
ncbi:recombinase family protein [Peptoanaerobacter stomatis]|nr:recombinase family protein [Peptoanaerobacter stomatis]